MFRFARTVVSTLLNGPSTRRYPAEKRPPFAGTRDRLVCDPVKCTYCTLCAKRCPSEALVVERAPQKSWTVNRHRCILCGFCAEVCPKDALAFVPHGHA